MAESTITCTFLRDGKKVTELSDKCRFTGREDLISVEFPDDVTCISDEAFKGCKNLTRVTARGVSRIENYAFSGCKNLEEFNI